MLVPGWGEDNYKMDNEKNLSFRVTGKWLLAFGVVFGLACQNSTKKVSLPLSAKHAIQLSEITRRDVNEGPREHGRS